MYQPSQLKMFLDSLGVRAKKSLSQNFLIDGNIIKKIISTSDVESEELVLEIGPGPGALTEALLKENAHVIAVEKDRILAEALSRLGSAPALTVYCLDILTLPLSDLFSQHLPKGKKAKVIANLPYHLTTPILILLAPLYEKISTLTIMVQKEVAERMVARPGCKEYGSLTLFLQFFAEVSLAFTVSRHCFSPKPNVDSAVVHLKLRPPPRVSGADAFFQLTRTAFNQRRKMLRRSLQPLYPGEKVESALVSLGCNPEARPEDLSLEIFCALFEALQRP